MEILRETIKNYSRHFYDLRPVGAVDYDGQEEDLLRFFRRLDEGNLSREENIYNHFCVYFAVYDPRQKEVFIGHHIKSGLWLFNGGHIEKDEDSRETVVREIQEELGNIDYKLPDVPNLLTITEIDNEKISCRTHWDIWYFIPVDKNQFCPEQEKLKTEFFENRWVPIDLAKDFLTNPPTLKALQILRQKY